MKNNSESKTTSIENFDVRVPRDYPWKILDRMVTDLAYLLDASDLDRIRQVTRLRDLPGLFLLAEDWSPQSLGSGGLTLAEMRAKIQLAALLKKFQFGTEREARVQAAIKKFKATEDLCGAYNREGYKALSVAEFDWEVNAFTYARAFLQKLLGFDLPDLNVMTEWSRHGPGATCDTKGGHVSSYFKYEKWPYQCTASAYRYARWVITHDERWLGALEDDYRARFKIPKWAILDRRVFWDSVLEVVKGNRITFVPKNAKIERSIAIEPTLNLYLQLGVDGFIRRRLKRWGVDLDHQEKNQEMARLGSTGGHDPFVTIDLADASNSVSLKLCELLLPDEWYDYLVDLRSPVGTLEGEIVEYNMISSMGNGYTFALESAIFTSIIYGVMKATGVEFSSSEFSVFGDDLIVRQSVSGKVIKMLANSGFRVNHEKSFLSGDFRESCGRDWFRGRPVRPVFLEDTPSSVPELFNDLNRLSRILWLRWGIEESETAKAIDKWIPEIFRDFTGPMSDVEFDGYRHSPTPKGRYKNCLWTYKKIVRRPTRVKAPSFFFRKLMHDLRPCPPPQKWEKRSSGSGSRFSVCRRNADTLGVTRSSASHWQAEYTE